MQQNAIYIHQLVFFSSQFITSCHFLYQIVGCYFWTPWLFEELNGQHTNRMHTKKEKINDLFMKLEFADSRIQIEAFAGFFVKRTWLFDHQILTLADRGKWKPFRCTESDESCVLIPDDRVQVWLPVSREFPARCSGVPAVAAWPHPWRRQLLIIIPVWKHQNQKQWKGQCRCNAVSLDSFRPSVRGFFGHLVQAIDSLWGGLFISGLFSCNSTSIFFFKPWLDQVRILHERMC